MKQAEAEEVKVKCQPFQSSGRPDILLPLLDDQVAPIR